MVPLMILVVQEKSDMFKSDMFKSDMFNLDIYSGKLEKLDLGQYWTFLVILGNFGHFW